jgi:pimeloyl-ACP methyl ester carboxylesterase
MSRTLFVAASALALTAALPRPARALDDVHCASGQTALAKTYLSIDNAAPGDTRANSSGKVRLRGWVFIPDGTPPPDGFPVLIFNHGSEESPSAKCVFADYFTAQKDFILFVPIRRGHTGSTGEYFEDYAARKAEESCPAAFCTDELLTFWRRYWTVEYLRDQRQDVVSAIDHLKGYPKANPHRIGVMGHSFGGIVSLFFNMLSGDDTRAVVDISGGAQSWESNEYLQQELKNAVDNAERPLYFLQPRNDASRLPTAHLSFRAGLRAMRWQASIFAPVPDSLIQPCPRPDPNDPTRELSCGDVAHGKFVTDATQVATWAPVVLEFLQRMGVR